MMNTKAQIPKGLNFVFALIVLAGGVIPLLALFGIIGEIPSIPSIVISILIVLGGILLLLDGFMGTTGNTTRMPKGLNFVVAIIVLVGGVVPLLSQFGVIGALPEIPTIVFQGLLVVAGLVLLLDGMLGVSTYWN
jgi:hypothetical protein